jgi:subtilisin-like proprotein convertase family protein
MDDKNGVVRSVVDVAAAAAAVDRVFTNPDQRLLIAPRADSPTLSTIDVDRTGLVGSVAVTVDLTHPEPEQLRMLLTSPDGTTVVLHDPDSASGSAKDQGVVAGGIAATYPHDREPVGSLGRFAARPAAGRWTLTIENDRTAAAAGDDAVLIGWSLVFAESDQPALEETTLVFPVVAHADGAHGTVWRSDVRLFNPMPGHDAEIRLFLVQPELDEGFGIRQTDVVVPHGSIVAVDDLVAGRFGLDAAVGSLVVQDSSAAVTHGTSRTYTTSSSGTYGQFIPPSAAGAGTTGAGEPPLVVLPVVGTDHRLNLGFTEIAGGSATVAVSLVDAVGGAPAGPSTFHAVQAFANLQINDVLSDTAQTVSDEVYAEITVVSGDGRISAYASVIDNRTGDAVFVAGSHPSVTPLLLVPVVARTSGQAGTRWQSDLRVLNHGRFTVNIDAEFRFQGGFGLPPVTRSVELQPGAAASIDDVVGTMFGFDEVAGSLRLVPREGPAALCATSRTANHSASGTYGQYVPALASGSGLTGAGTVLHVSKSATVRSNVGIVETSGTGVHLTVRLLDRIGRTLGSPIDLGLGPWESVQLNDIFAVVGAQGSDTARVAIETTGGPGRFFAYGSVIDAVSGDAIFVPILPIPEPLTN